MRLRKLLIVCGIILFISGCSSFVMICSLNPFYLKENITLVTEIEGDWKMEPIQSEKDSSENNSTHWGETDIQSTWSIRQRIDQETQKTKRGKDTTIFKPQNNYLVRLLGADPDSGKYLFLMVVFKINNVLYADFSPYEYTPVDESRMAIENYFAVHTLARITFQGKQPIISWLSTDCMKEMIEQKRVRVKYRYVSDAKRLLLTASSEDLTEMIKRYAHQKRFIDWENQPAMLKLNRIK